MILSKASAEEQVKHLLLKYTDLEVIASSPKILIRGNIEINRIYNDFHLHKSYLIEIIIPFDSDELPYVRDIGNHIDKRYPHRYFDGRLCLDTDSCIKIRFLNGFSLETWMEDYVEAYYFSYEYYMRYREFPFGERAHNLTGILQTYSEFFNEPDYKKTFLLMSAISKTKYRGHSLCPCGSKKKLRNCHGQYVYRFYTDERLKSITVDDYNLIVGEIKKYNDYKKNKQ